MKANDLLFYHFYSHSQSFQSIPQTTKVETYQKAKDQSPTQTYLFGPRVWWVSPPGRAVGCIPSRALCPALWPKAQASLQGPCGWVPLLREGRVCAISSWAAQSSFVPGKEGGFCILSSLMVRSLSKDHCHLLPSLTPLPLATPGLSAQNCPEVCFLLFSIFSLVLSYSFHFLCLFHLILLFPSRILPLNCSYSVFFSFQNILSRYKMLSLSKE